MLWTEESDWQSFMGRLDIKREMSIMNFKKNIFTALLLAVGFILHQITPGILGGMKFDFLLIFILISILLNNTFKNAVLTGMLGGLLSAMTTTFPGGQIPNIIDKMVTCIIMFLIIKLLSKFKLNIFIVALIGALGTFISGTTFLLSALVITGLPVPFWGLFIAIVIPTTIINGIGTVFVFSIVEKAIKITGVAI